MKKCGVHPKPFRSRLLVFVPVIVALYMFVWPTFKREVMFPLLSDSDPQVWGATYGVWLGETAKFPGWTDHLIVEDFWKTFAPWYIAIPFIFICSFGVVYFLGNKGFCTYGCPYGGFFGPIDYVSVGRIVVNDKCEGCGHCTAVCTSNVRVHEEVRDFGMVMDPGCMKCMDCVSVCPNEALSFSFAKPSILTGPRSPEIKARRASKPKTFDLTWPEEIFLAIVFLGLTLGFRGMLNEIPLLMALGMAGIGTFFAWKLIQMVREKSTRIHSFQLKMKGRVRPAGFVFVPLAVAVLVSGAWAAGIKYTKRRAELTAVTVEVPAQQLLTAGFVADAKSRETAQRALGLFQKAGPPREGGWGWRHTPDELQTIAYLNLVIGDLKATEQTLMEIMSRGQPLDPLVLQLGSVMHLGGAGNDAVAARYEQILTQQPRLSQVRSALAGYYVGLKKDGDAVRLYEEAVRLRPGDPIVRADFGMWLVQLGQEQRGMRLLEESVQIARGERQGMEVREDPEALRQIARTYQMIKRPDLALPQFEYLATLKKPKRPADILFDVANAQYILRRAPEAIDTMKAAAAENPENPHLLMSLAQMCEAAGRPGEAQEWARKAEELQKSLQDQQAKRAEKVRVWRGDAK